MRGGTHYCCSVLSSKGTTKVLKGSLIHEQVWRGIRGRADSRTARQHNNGMKLGKGASGSISALPIPWPPRAARDKPRSSTRKETGRCLAIICVYHNKRTSAVQSTVQTSSDENTKSALLLWLLLLPSCAGHARARTYSTWCVATHLLVGHFTAGVTRVLPAVRTMLSTSRSYSTVLYSSYNTALTNKTTCVAGPCINTQFGDMITHSLTHITGKLLRG